MAARYAIGTGNWSSTGTWSTSSGGATGATVPTAADDVFLDANTTALTMDAASVCRSINCTGFTGTFTLNAFAFSIGDATAGASNIALKFVSGMTFSPNGSSSIQFLSTSATVQEVDFAGKQTPGVTFNGVGGSWNYTGSHSHISSVYNTTLTNGTLNLNGQTVTWGRFLSNNSNTRSLTLGAAVITLTGSSATVWDISTATGLTFSGGIVSITCSGTSPTFVGNNLSYGAVYFTGSGTAISGSSTTFNILSRTGTASKTDGLQLNGNATVTGTFEVLGNSAINRVLVSSNLVGIARIVIAGGTSFANVDFMDINGTGGGSWDLSVISGGSGDCGGNTGITFTTPSTKTWSGTSGGNWSANTWSGTGVPLPQDRANLGKAFSASQTITADMPRMGSIDFTGATGSPTFSPSAAISIHGSFTLVSGMTVGGAAVFWDFRGRSSYTITHAGVSNLHALRITAPNGTYTLQDALTTTNTSDGFNLQNGRFDANGFTVTTPTFTSNSGSTRTVTFGSSNIVLTATAATTVLNLSSTSLTLNAGSSTVTIGTTSANDRGLSLSGLTFGTITYTIAGSTGQLSLSGAAGQPSTIATLNFSDVTNARTLSLQASRQFNITTFNVNGTSGKLMSIISSSAATAATISKTSGTVSCDYLSIQDSTATGGAAFYAGANSTNVSGNTGWIFTAPSAGVGSSTMSIGELEYSAYATKTGVSGIPLIQQKLIFYNSQLGSNYYSVDEAEVAWLKNKTTLYTEQSRDHLWRSYLVGRGITFQATLNDMKRHFFLTLGFA